MFWRREKLFALVGNRKLHRPAKALYQLRHAGTELIKSSVTLYSFNGSFNVSKRNLLMINLLFIANSMILNLPPNRKSHSAGQEIS